MFVTAADGYEVLSNGKLAGKKGNGDGTTVWHWTQPQPHASYLMTLVVGKFDIVRDEWRGKEVSYYVPVGHKDDVRRSFGRTPDMIEFFSRRFGIDYPWEKYAQVVVEQFTAGGMENTTATTLNDYALLDERALLDGDVDDLVSHELGHQWWGDLVTCKDWAHIWLNEGFASYCEILWEEHRHGADGAQLRTCGTSSGLGHPRGQEPADRRSPLSERGQHVRRPGLSEGGVGAAHAPHAARRRRVLPGPAHLRQREPLQERRDGDFRKVMERVSGRDLERFFYDWTERPGHPVLNVGDKYLPDTQAGSGRGQADAAGRGVPFPAAVAIQELSERIPPKKPVELRDLDKQLPEPVGLRTRRLKSRRRNRSFS